MIATTSMMTFTVPGVVFSDIVVSSWMMIRSRMRRMRMMIMSRMRRMRMRMRMRMTAKVRVV